MRWLQCLSFRAPGSRVILVANKCDTSIDDFVETTEKVEARVRELLDGWQRTRGSGGRGEGRVQEVTVHPGMRRVSCLSGNSPEGSGLQALTALIRAQAATSVPAPVAPAWALALEFVESLRVGGAPTRAVRESPQLLDTTVTEERDSRVSPFVSRDELSRQWSDVVDT